MRRSLLSILLLLAALGAMQLDAGSQQSVADALLRASIELQGAQGGQQEEEGEEGTAHGEGNRGGVSDSAMQRCEEREPRRDNEPTGD